MVSVQSAAKASVQAVSGKGAGSVTAARILRVSQEMTALIENRLSTRSSAKGPLFVLLGESHSRATHILAHMRTVLALKERGYRIAVGVERPYNSAESVLDMLQMIRPGAEPVRILREKMTRLNAYDRRRVMIANNLCDEAGAEVTSKLRNRTWVQSHISVAFNDAAHDNRWEATLDMKDRVMRRMLSRQGIQADDEAADLYSTSSMYVRNHLMIDRGRRHAAARKADIFVQICGNDHVAGCEDEKKSSCLVYDESMMGLLMAAGDDVVGISLLSDVFDESSLPLQAHENGVHAIRLSGPAFNEKVERETDWLNNVMPRISPDYSLDDGDFFEKLLKSKTAKAAKPAP